MNSTEDNLAEQWVLVENLFELGGKSSNQKLREKLKWDKDKYFSVRNSARAGGLVGLARGQGGVVFITNAEDGSYIKEVKNKRSVTEVSEDYLKEKEYYDKIAPVFRQAWIQSEGFDDFVVEITASKRVKGVGRWTVPDIVIVGKSVRQYVPGFEFTVQSIEVKRFEALDALAVFESLNHKRSAHYSYLLVVNFPKKPKQSDSEKIGHIHQLCEEHNVGLITIETGDESNYDNWNFEFNAFEKHEPNPDNLDSFIKRYMSDESKDVIAKMVR